MAARTLLQLVGEFYKRTGLGAAPIAVTGSQDDTVLQIWALLNEGVEEMACRPFNDLQQDLTFTHLARGNNLAMVFDIDLPDFKGLITGTFYDSQTRIRVAGPIGQRSWSEMVNMNVTAAQYQYRMAGGGLYIYPTPGDYLNYFFNWTYQSCYGVQAQDETAGTPHSPGVTKLWFEADTDRSRLPYRLLLTDLRWRWKREKGMAYEEEQKICEDMIMDHLNTQGASPDIDMGDPTDVDGNVPVGPGLLIAAGNWPL